MKKFFPQIILCILCFLCNWYKDNLLLPIFYIIKLFLIIILLFCYYDWFKKKNLEYVLKIRKLDKELIKSKQKLLQEVEPLLGHPLFSFDLAWVSHFKELHTHSFLHIFILCLCSIILST